LQERPIILSILLAKATSYVCHLTDHTFGYGRNSQRIRSLMNSLCSINTELTIENLYPPHVREARRAQFECGAGRISQMSTR